MHACAGRADPSTQRRHAVIPRAPADAGADTAAMLSGGPKSRLLQCCACVLLPRKPPSVAACSRFDRLHDPVCPPLPPPPKHKHAVNHVASHPLSNLEDSEGESHVRWVHGSISMTRQKSAKCTSRGPPAVPVRGTGFPGFSLPQRTTHRKCWFYV